METVKENARRLRGRYRAFVLVVAFLSFIMSAPRMVAQTRSVNGPRTNSDRIADNYLRNDFTVEDGLPDSVVNSVIQTENGLLWVGTSAGLARFDGQAFTPINLQSSGFPSQGAVHALLESKQGDLWVGTDAGVLCVPRIALDRFDSKLVKYYSLATGPTRQVEALFQDRQGVMWVGTNHGLYRQQGGDFSAAIPATYVSRINEALNGHLLLITGLGFIEWDGHEILRHPGLAGRLGVHDDQIFDVFQDHRGAMWYATDRGVKREGPAPMPPLEPATPANAPTYGTYEDQDGHCWVRTGIGVFRISGNTMETVALGRTRAFYISKDGELWIGTNGSGLIHLKRRLVRVLTEADGLPNEVQMTVLPTHDGKLWVGSNCGLSVLEGTKFKFYAENQGLLNSCVWTLAEDHERDLWIGTYGGGMFRFHAGHFSQYSLEQGLVSNVAREIVVAHDDSLWIATPDGISHMQNGKFRNFTVSDGLSNNRVLSVYQDRMGRIWAATQEGIDRLDGNRFIPIVTGESQSGRFPIALAEDSLGDLYVFSSPRGISIIENDRVTVVNDQLSVTNMIESSQHDLWFSGNHGVLRIRLNDFKRSFSDHEDPLDYELIDRADGLSTIQCSVGAPSLAITPDNKLWIATVKGLATLDLGSFTDSSPKPKAFVGTVTIDKNQELAGEKAVLPPGTHHVELHLEAVDLASPEKIRLQYRLDGVDASWLDVDAARTAVYSTLPVGTHAFHVRASSRAGVWDRTGIVYEVTQTPFFYQTIWFRLVTICVVLVILCIAYFLRMRQIVWHAHMRLEAQVSERERIGRDLHDTFFQGIEGFLLHFHVVTSHLQVEPEITERIGTAFSEADAVMSQGRSLIFALRKSTNADDLEGDIQYFIDGIRSRFKGRVELHVSGKHRSVIASASENIFPIVREAVWNAARHAHGSLIKVAIEYASTSLQVSIEDDGVGIEPRIIFNGGLPGHWGIPGIRERAKQLGAELEIGQSGLGGARIYLRVPSRRVYVSPFRTLVARWSKTS